jgi:hypothetical protein
MTRDKQIKVQVDEAEKAVIENKARLAGMSASSFLRELALGFTTHTQEASQQVSQVDPRVDTLEANVLSLQVQLQEISQKLAKLANEHSHQENAPVCWNEGDIIDARYGRRYHLLLTSEHQKQTWDTKNAEGRLTDRTSYRWYKSLGIVCAITDRSRSDRWRFRIVGVFEPGLDLELTDEGNFIHPDGYWYYKKPDQVSPVSQEVSQKANVCVEESLSEAIALVPENVADELPSPDLSQKERPQPEATSVFLENPSADTTKVPNQMAAKEFREYYSLSSGDYGSVTNDARARASWVSPDGLRWRVDGKAKRAVWTQVTPSGSADDT